VRFWDTSALIPLILAEDRSAEILGILNQDPFVVTSAYTVVEVTSAIWRRRHAGEISIAAHQDADRLFADLSQAWTEVPVSQVVIDHAVSLISRHPLRAADGLQLATAYVAAGATPMLPFVTIDKRLIAAASAEGFAVLP